MTALPEQLDNDAARALTLELGLSDREYDVIVDNLGRPPRRTEIALFVGMWSEHCSYKSSLHWLEELPRDAERILAGPGAHAGVVDVGDGWAVAFKIESHNHPSAVEPYQGAATGVGGILRDIVAQGARPCAVMDSLCFGEPDEAQTQHIRDGVVAGIAGYGNAYGVPNVGGRTIFDRRYSGNPLVNALAAGFIRHDELRTASASGLGNHVLYVGAPTGRDGILGAAFASEELGDDSTQDRPHVQVGDPFGGKKLMEACLSFGPQDGMIACQDMGACGLTCAATEMAAAGGVGIEIDLADIPKRESGMTPQEVLLSESQERFLFVVADGREQAAVQHFRSWGVRAALCGKVVDGDRVVIRDEGVTFVDLPAALVADGAPPADWPLCEKTNEDDEQEAVSALLFSRPQDLGVVLLRLLAQPSLKSAEEITSRYDQTVGNRTVAGPGQSEAAILRLPDSRRGFALSIATGGMLCAADPSLGAQAAVSQVMRDLACSGAELVAITDGLNMSSPTDPQENRKLRDVILGIKIALEGLDIPVTGGNVSLYNESRLGHIPPTPMIGGLGLVDDVSKVPSVGFTPGQRVFLLGTPSDRPCAGAFARSVGGVAEAGVPAVDFDAEKRLAALLVELCRRDLLVTAKDGGQGGLGVALAKLCLRGHQDVDSAAGYGASPSGCGVQITLPDSIATGRLDWRLFGEWPATAWISASSSAVLEINALAKQHGVAICEVGQTGGDRLSIAGAIDLSLSDLAAAFIGSGPSR